MEYTNQNVETLHGNVFVSNGNVSGTDAADFKHCA